MEEEIKDLLARLATAQERIDTFATQMVEARSLAADLKQENQALRRRIEGYQDHVLELLRDLKQVRTP